MASMTIRNLDENVKQRLRLRAVEHGHSMEQEARVILRAALRPEAPGDNDLAGAIRARFAPFGGVELELPPRDPIREAPDFR